mmetsp:Transcript_46883/g.69356  ORF Transcript_46883/g.69356 Transcript_46883/m.69356 type:complete len:91 (+) Transcript_46883:132-404(+)
MSQNKQKNTLFLVRNINAGTSLKLGLSNCNAQCLQRNSMARIERNLTATAKILARVVGYYVNEIEPPRLERATGEFSLVIEWQYQWRFAI